MLVLEREAAAGGIPRHSDHPGYGMRDLNRFLSGPAYARRLTTAATHAGAAIQTAAMVTGWTGERHRGGDQPRGPPPRPGAERSSWPPVRANAPAPPGWSPATGPPASTPPASCRTSSTCTTGPAGTRAVIVGAELVSWSAVMTLREAGCRTVLMTTVHPAPESYAAFTIAGRVALRIPVAIPDAGDPHHRPRPRQAVEIEDLDTGARRIIDCDTVVFTGDWIPDNELARAAGLDMDPGSRGPLVDTRLRRAAPGVFAIGNLVHPVDTADVAALDGRHVAPHVLAHLHHQLSGANGPRITPGTNLKWISPGILDPTTTPPRKRLLSWPRLHITIPTVTITQNRQPVAQRRLPWPASPGRAFRIPASMLDHAHSDGGTITIDIH